MDRRVGRINLNTERRVRRIDLTTGGRKIRKVRSNCTERRVGWKDLNTIWVGWLEKNTEKGR